MYSDQTGGLGRPGQAHAAGSPARAASSAVIRVTLRRDEPLDSSTEPDRVSCHREAVATWAPGSTGSALLPPADRATCHLGHFLAQSATARRPPERHQPAVTDHLVGLRVPAHRSWLQQPRKSCTYRESAHQLRWRNPANGSDTLAMAQIRWQRTFLILIFAAPVPSS